MAKIRRTLQRESPRDLWGVDKWRGEAKHLACRANTQKALTVLKLALTVLDLDYLESGAMQAAARNLLC